MNVNLNRQTLILAGEANPGDSALTRQVTAFISARVDAIVQTQFSPTTARTPAGSIPLGSQQATLYSPPSAAAIAPVDLPEPVIPVYQAHPIPNRGYATNRASEYVRTRDDADRRPLIDLYA